ncbi:MAG: multiubiquitin domain-containing protein [Solirubrobacteraceae bacterium]|nr:multiubiquitin domain-containing protein [Solirubrobacteraceae bacterium]
MQSQETKDKDRDNPGDRPEHTRETTIIVNAQEKTVTTKEVTFEQVVDLAYDGDPPQGDNWLFTVTYRRGADESPQGSLVKGASVKVKKGMVFNVTATDKS